MWVLSYFYTNCTQACSQGTNCPSRNRVRRRKESVRPPPVSIDISTQYPPYPILKQHYIAESALSQTSTPFSLIKRQEYRSSHGKLEANIGNEPPGMVITSTATQSACPTEIFIATPSAIPPPPTSLEATIGASKI